ncbi:MAG: elongation factor Ts [bacterium]|nr:elongation factor Ts [bacterium]
MIKCTMRIMTNIEKIKEVRERSGVGLGQCKAALQKVGWNIEAALVELQKQGLLKSASDHRDSKEGCVNSYIHTNGKLVAVVEINCQTDFAARNSEFKEFADQCVLQIASMNPKWLTSGDVPVDVLDAQREIFKAQVLNTTPADKVEHIINGKMRKWFSDVCLMDQKSVIIAGVSIEQLRANLAMKLNENIIIRRFIRWSIEA